MILAGSCFVSVPDNVDFTDGGTGFGDLKILIMDNVGGRDINVTVTYKDQDNNIEPAAASTLIPSGTLSGTYIPVILNAGDVLVKDVTGVSITGGVHGDRFELHIFTFYFARPLSMNFNRAGKEDFSLKIQSQSTGKTFEREKAEIPASSVKNPSIMPIIFKRSGLTDHTIESGNPPFRPREFSVNMLRHELPVVITGIQRTITAIRMQRGWDERVVGQVVSGHVLDQDGSLIKNAFKVLLISSYSSGKEVMGDVDPQTSVYQVFLKPTLYDKSYLLISDPVKRLYEQQGSMDLDGRQRIDVIDLKFARIEESAKRIGIGFRKKGMVGLNVSG
jgi:hypothetical protein